jgi:CDP-4-dehydro-6-deoxyglucose reductase
LHDEAGWKRSHPGIELVPVYSEPAAGDAGRGGLVHEAVLQDLPDLSAHEVYACGNPLMIEAARNDFTRRAKLRPECFFSDAFVFRPSPKS